MNSIKKIIFFTITLGFSTALFASNTVCNGSGCIITVDWALDEVPSSNLHTCDYTQGAATFFPAADGKCSFRRALREAGARSDENFCPGCQPVLIRFTGLNGSNSDADDVQFNASTSQWVLPIAGGSTSFFGLKPQTITEVTGFILIQGPTVDVLNGEMPKIMIDSGKTLDLQLTDITIRNMGFMGGMSIHWKEENGIFTNNTWGLDTDGLSIMFDDFVGNTDNLAGNHAILTTNKADNMLVDGNVLTGASTFAVEINSATTGVQIINNLIGTRIDGTVPTVPANVKCRTFTNINPVSPPLQASEWFAGAGISASGTGLLIENNVIAGMQSIHSTNSTPPEALTVFGRLHTVQNNIIGKDLAGTEVGVCGQGLKLSTQRDSPEVNNGHMILDNEIYSPRNGFDNTTGAILWSDSHVNGFKDGGNTIRRNIVKTGLEKYIEFGPMLMSVQKSFEPAVIASVTGVNVSGHSHASNIFGDPSPCPNCIVDFYLDNDDANLDALEWLGQATADGNGDFSGTISHTLADGFGIRTTSTTTADNVISNTWSGTTSEMSTEVYGVISDVIFQNGFE
jgi:hypothetical protein